MVVAVRGGREEKGSSCVVGISLQEEMQTLVCSVKTVLRSEMPGISWPPKGGHLSDKGGTHSSQSRGTGGATGCRW